MAHLSPRANGRNSNGETTDTECVDSDAATSEDASTVSSSRPLAGQSLPELITKIWNPKSVLALAVSESKIYAGTQDGDILVWSPKTFESLGVISAHRHSTLSLFLSEDDKFLLSSGGDAFVNIWCTNELRRLYCIYSTFDVGDVFCVAFSTTLQTVYLGAQNTSVQWYDLSQKDSRPPPDSRFHPRNRKNKFFDSTGPGGISTPRPTSPVNSHAQGGQMLEIDREHIVQYAHFGYVYCMVLAKGLNGFSSNEETLISGGGDGAIKLWQLGNFGDCRLKEVASLGVEDVSVLSLALDGTLLYSGKLEGEIDVWDLDTHQRIRRVKAHDSDVLTLSVSHGFLFSGSSNGYAKTFNQRYKCVNKWKAHDHLILASAISSHDRKINYVTGGNDNSVAVWNFTKFVKPSRKMSTSSNEELSTSMRKFVSFPTVSSKSEHAEDCRRGASWLRGLFNRFGASTEMITTEEHLNPIVFARFQGVVSPDKERKKVLFYGHYDVIAAERSQSQWKTDPFEMQGVDGYLYGRGASDNKGPVLAALYAVVDLISEQKLDLDILFLIEGEEECGSRGFETAIKKNKHIIGDLDWVLVSNSYWLNDDFPCITYGLRGVIHASITIKSDRPDLHSGVDGNHRLREASKDLTHLLASLSEPEGHIKIPGFYEPVLPMTDAEAERYDTIIDTLRIRDPCLPSSQELVDAFKARWREPSLTFHRFTTSGPTNSTVIPHTASAAVSVRTVPDQNTESLKHALIEYLHEQFAEFHTSNSLSVQINHQAEPWLGDPTNQLFRTLEKAVMEVWSPDVPQKPLYIREGGSIPAIRFLEKEFNAPAAQLPCGQASDNAHLDNERLRLANLYNSRKIFKKVFADLPKN